MPADRWLTLIGHNLGTKVISIIIALVLWVVVLGSRSVEVTKDVPLEVTMPSDLVASSEVPERVSFRLSGPKAFLRAILDRPEDPIRVNLLGSKSGVVTYRFFSDNIHLPIGVRVLAIQPSALTLKLEELRKKELKVRLEVKGEAPEGYQIARTEIFPKTIRVKGAVSKLESLAELSSEPVDLSEIRGDQQIPLEFNLQNQGLKIDGPMPVLKVTVAAVQANYKLKNVDVKVLSDHSARMDETSVTIYVRIDPDAITGLDRSRISAVVDLRGKNKGRYQEAVKVTVPPGIGLVRVVPEKIRVTLY